MAIPKRKAITERFIDWQNSRDDIAYLPVQTYPARDCFFHSGFFLGSTYGHSYYEAICNDDGQNIEIIGLSQDPDFYKVKLPEGIKIIPHPNANNPNAKLVFAWLVDENGTMCMEIHCRPNMVWSRIQRRFDTACNYKEDTVTFRDWQKPLFSLPAIPASRKEFKGYWSYFNQLVINHLPEALGVNPFAYWSDKTDDLKEKIEIIKTEVPEKMRELLQHIEAGTYDPAMFGLETEQPKVFIKSEISKDEVSTTFNKCSFCGESYNDAEQLLKPSRGRAHSSVRICEPCFTDIKSQFSPT